MKFLIQTFDYEVEHDFSFTLIQQIKNYNHFQQKEGDKIEYVYSNKLWSDLSMEEKLDYEDFIPIGSVEFVQSYVLKYHGRGRNITPINIPECLNKNEYLDRDIFRIKNDGKDSIENGLINTNCKSLFIKSDSAYKGFQTDIISNFYSNDWKLPNYIGHDIFASNIIDIESEWRGFVHRGKLLDIRNYSGNPLVFPDVLLIKKMISDYEASDTSPIAYTIDVAIRKKQPCKTVLIEIHDFFSCGLYGFDNEKLPWMFSQWYHEYLRKNKLK